MENPTSCVADKAEIKLSKTTLRLQTNKNTLVLLRTLVFCIIWPYKFSHVMMKLQVFTCEQMIITCITYFSEVLIQFILRVPLLSVFSTEFHSLLK